MAPKLFITLASPPVRAVLMFAKAIDLELDLKDVDFQKEENRSPEYLKINPQHTVPALVDHDFSIWDSHAIIPYLYTVYGKNDELYPKEPKQRAIIDQRLHFDSGVAFAALKNAVLPIWQQKKTKITEEDRAFIAEVYDFMEIFLEGHDWVAGDKKSIADFCLIASVTSLDILLKMDVKKYPNVGAWLKRFEALPEYEENKEGLSTYRDFLEKFL